MIIDITKTNLINIQEGDIIYSVAEDIIGIVTEIESINTLSSGKSVHIYTDTELSYIGGYFEHIDAGTYKIFREIIIN